MCIFNILSIYALSPSLPFAARGRQIPTVSSLKRLHRPEYIRATGPKESPRNRSLVFVHPSQYQSSRRGRRGECVCTYVSMAMRMVCNHLSTCIVQITLHALCILPSPPPTSPISHHLPPPFCFYIHQSTQLVPSPPQSPSLSHPSTSTL